MAGAQVTSHRHLYFHGESAIHQLAPEAKLLGLFTFVLAVALTPRTAVAAFTVDTAVLLVVLRLALVPVHTLLTRLAVIIPILIVAAALPFVGSGEQITLAAVSLSVDGTWAAWNTAIKAFLGAGAGIVVVATTPIPSILSGLQRLHLPSVLVSIVSFMFRYLDLVVAELARMRTAMVARGHDPRWLWQARPIASSAGALFVRTYERGERVHDAMLARGFTGTVPSDESLRSNGQWLVALAPAAVAWAGLVLAMVIP